MDDYRKALQYLEKAIMSSAFATKEGLSAVEDAVRAGSDAVVVAIRFSKIDDVQRQKLMATAEGLTKCGVSAIEERAGQIALLLDPSNSSLAPDTLSAPVSGDWKPSQEMSFNLSAVTGYSLEIGSIAISPDGRRALCTAWKSLHYWDLENGQEISSIKYRDSLNSVAFSKGGRYALIGCGTCGSSPGSEAAGGGDFSARLRDLERNIEVRRFVPEPERYYGRGSPVSSVAFFPDGRRIVGGSEGGCAGASIWSIDSGRLLQFLPGGDCNFVAVSHDGGKVLAGHGRYRKTPGSGEEYALIVHDAGTGNQICKFTQDYPPFFAGAFAPDDQTVIAESGERLDVYNMGSSFCKGPQQLDPNSPALGLWAALRRMMRPSAIVRPPERIFMVPHVQCSAHASTCDFTPDGKALIYISGRNLCVWDLSQSKVVRVFEHKNKVRTIAVPRNGAYVLSTSERTMHLWPLPNI